MLYVVPAVRNICLQQAHTRTRAHAHARAHTREYNNTSSDMLLIDYMSSDLVRSTYVYALARALYCISGRDGLGHVTGAWFTTDNYIAGCHVYRIVAHPSI